MASIWKGRIVSDSTIATAIKWARKALGDTGRDQRYIRTVRGRGVQFVAALEVVADKSDSAFALYVRPIDTMGNCNLDSIARVLRARIGTVLMRIPLMQVAASFPQADQVTDPRETQARFGLSHLLDIRLQQAGATLNALVALTQTKTGLQIWAQSFEVPVGPGDQEILLHKIIRRTEPRLLQAMVTEMDSPDGSVNSGSLLLEAIALLALKGWHQTTFLAASQLIEQAISLDPDVALSHGYHALIKALGHRVGLLREDVELIPTVISAAENALALDSQDSTVLGLVGCALADVGQVDRAIPILRKAIEAGPQNGHARTALGAALMMKQEYKAAERHLAEGMACSPADSRLSVWGTALAMAQLAQGNLDSALESANDACREDDKIYLPRLALAGIHLVRHEKSQALAAVRETLRTKPDLTEAEIACVLGERLGGDLWSIVQSLSG